MPLVDGDTDFTFRQFMNEEETVRYVVDTYARMVRTLSWQNVQVLSPMHRNPCGVENLNRLLQARVNPPSPDKAEHKAGNTVYREGDKVMQIRNNYEKNVLMGTSDKLTSFAARRSLYPFRTVPKGQCDL